MATRGAVDRKQEIIDAAFALAAEKPDWSLADVAARIGVTKTALYRHFKNRAEIEDRMDDGLVEALAATIEEFAPDRPAIRTAIARLFRERRGYLHRIMVKSAESDHFAEGLLRRMIAASPKASALLSGFESREDSGNVWLETTVIKNWISILIASFPDSDAESLRDALFNALENGIPSLSMPGDGRLDGLEAASAVETGETGERNRLFSAIAASIRAYGVKGTTIETIAEQMGTAKSSLYFYSPNKRDMLLGLYEHERGTLESLYDARVGLGSTFAEQLFVVMMTTANYLIANPDVAPAFNWIRSEIIHDGPNERPRHDCDGRMVDAYRYGELVPADPEKGKAYAALTIKWATMLGVSCAIRGFELRLDAQKIRNNVRIMFESMINGDKHRR